MDLLEAISCLPDPREDYKIKYPLPSLLFTTLCGVLCGCQSWLDVSDFCEAKKEWLSKYVDLSMGIPSFWTFRRLFILLDPVVVEKLLMSISSQLLAQSKSDQIAIDGKTHRGSKRHNRRPLQTVSAWCHESGLVLGEVAVDACSHETKTIPLLLDSLNLKDTTISIDAAGCNSSIASSIIAKGGNYVLALKGNQPKLHAAIKSHMEVEAKESGNLKEDHFDSGHGRLLRRRYFTSDIRSMNLEEKWPGVKTAIAVETISSTKRTPVTVNWRYYLSSHTKDHPHLAKYVRNHWGIENKLHWILDVQMNEDNDTKAERRSTRAFATLRRIALNIVKTKDQTPKRSTRRKMLVASWKDENLMKLLL